MTTTQRELVSLKKTDPQFQRYLLGPFAKGKKVSIVQSLNPTQANEIVTFALDNYDFSFSDYATAVAEAMKLSLLLYVVSPLFLIRVHQLQAHVLAFRFVLVSFFAFLFFEATALLVEYREHSQGMDRILGTSFQKPLQRGIFTAQTLLGWGLFFLGLSFVVGVALLYHFTPGLLLASGVLLCAFVWMSPAIRAAHNYWAEISCYLLFGPLLFVGIQMGSSFHVDLEVILMGLAFGLLPLWNFYLKNFCLIFLQEHEYFKNSIFHRGFDQSKIFLMRFWLVLICSFLAFHFCYRSKIWFLFDVIICLTLTTHLLFQLRALQSPLGSRMQLVIRVGRLSGLTILTLWVAEDFVTAFFL